MQLKDQPGHAWQDSRRTGAHEKLKVGNRNREAATACVVVEPSCKRVVSHTTGTAARQGAEAPIPPYTNKYKGGTLESPSRVRAGTAKGRSPQQTCVGWNRRRVEALGNAPPLRPCETPALMMRKQAAYRRSQHGALRSRSPPTIRLTLYQCRVE